MLQIIFVNLTKGPLWLVDSKYSVGASSVHPIRTAIGDDDQAELLVGLNSVSVSGVSDEENVFLNGRPLVQITKEKRHLVHGDYLSIGGLELQLIDPKIVKSQEDRDQNDGVKNDKGWSLRALNYALANHEFSITKTCIIGRSQTCDISLSVAHLSRKHAQFIVSPHGLSVEDLGSSNGTFVNGKKIQQTNLQNGDELSFDTLKFEVIGPEIKDVIIDTDKTTLRAVSTSSSSTRSNVDWPKRANAQLSEKVRNEKAQVTQEDYKKDTQKHISSGTLPAPRFGEKKTIKNTPSTLADISMTKAVPNLSILSEPQIIHDKSEEGVSSKVLWLSLLIFSGLGVGAYFLFFAGS